MSPNILAVDPSSTCCGVVIIKNGNPSSIAHHTVNKKLDIGRRMYEFGKFLTAQRAKQKIDFVAIEKVSHTRNVHTIRMLSYFGAVVLYKAGEWNVPTIEVTVKEARKSVFQSGLVSKEYVYLQYAKKYNLAPYDKGGNDEADALCIGFFVHKQLLKGKITANGRKAKNGVKRRRAKAKV